MIKLSELFFLQQIKGFGKVKIHKALDLVEKSENLDQLFEELLSCYRLNSEDLSQARTVAKQKYDALMQQENLKILTVFDPEYPQGLLSLNSKKPVILYAKGDTTILNRAGVSVVGTRHPSPWTQKFGKNISKQIGLISNRVIVSGLAIGCDRFAHEGALIAGVPTIAVLPSGVNVITPPSHKELALEIIEKGGCLISEYEPDAAALTRTFVERDSVIAAMTDITYVIECEEKSGTMHTVDAAYKMNRRLACYYPDQKALERGAKESDYLGNKMMIDKMNAAVIAKEEDLHILFKSPKEQAASVNNASNEETHQLTIADLVNDGE